MDGLVTYKTLKWILDVECSTMTKFSATLGTSIPHVKDVVVRSWGTEIPLDDPMDQAILDAVRTKIQESMEILAQAV
jgi:hypothetical protein